MLERVADKWTMLVIVALARGPLRFTRILEANPGISHRMLTKTLLALHRDGMVTRTAYAETPPRVDYELTHLGQTLIDPMSAFVEWAEQYGPQVHDNRAHFDA